MTGFVKWDTFFHELIDHHVKFMWIDDNKLSWAVLSYRAAVSKCLNVKQVLHYVTYIMFLLVRFAVKFNVILTQLILSHLTWLCKLIAHPMIS